MLLKRVIVEVPIESVKSVFVRKKRLLQICWMLRYPRIKRDMKGSTILTIKEGRNLKG